MTAAISLSLVASGGCAQPAPVAAMLAESTTTAIQNRAIIARSLLGKLQTHLPVTLGVIAPAVAHLHEQEQVHLLLDDVGKLALRRLADRLDRLPGLAEHDLLLAIAFDIDGLLDADRTVLALGPALGLDRGLIRQFLVQFQVKLLARD